MTRRITNTQKLRETNPGSLLGLALALGASESIEAMEAAGQQELCRSSQIPTELMHGLTEHHLRAMGFVLLAPSQSDPLFREAMFPPGWETRPTSHSMWSKIVDDKGRERLSVFYKAAPYDRSAHLSYVTRFGVSAEYPSDETRVVTIRDGETHVKRWPEQKREDYEALDRDRATATEWLRAHYADYQNPLAYWDDTTPFPSD